MSADEDLDVGGAKAFRPNRKPLLFAVVANLALALIFLVFPWYRGHLRSGETNERFRSFAACFWGGSAVRDGGLGRVAGDEEQYAAMVLRGPPEWPGRCLRPLRRIKPSYAAFLFPSVKDDEATVGAAVRMVERELRALDRERRAGIGRVPRRPVLAMGRLAAALTVLSENAGVEDLERPAVRLRRVGSLIAPERIPIRAASTALVDLVPGRDTLDVIALDSRGVSAVHLENRRLDVQRFKRPGLVRGAIPSAVGPVLVWAMRDEQCADRPGGCLRRATGVAPIAVTAATDARPEGRTEPPEPRFLSGHPLVRFDRAVAWRPDGTIDLVARRAPDESAPAIAEVLRFAPGPPMPEGAPPALPISRFALDGIAEGDDALLAPGDPARVVWTTHDATGLTVRMRILVEGDAAILLTTPAMRGEGAWLLACDAGDASWIAAGTSTHGRLIRLPDAGAPFVSPPFAIAAGRPLDASDPASDRARLVCERDLAHLVLRRADRDAGVLVACDARRCGAPAEIARRVERLDAVRGARHTLVAWSGDHERPLIRIARFDHRGQAVGEPLIPAACWEPDGGFCHQPYLAAGPGRIVLAARDSTDVLVIETTDDGAQWKTLRGLR